MRGMQATVRRVLFDQNVVLTERKKGDHTKLEKGAVSNSWNLA